MDLQLQKRQLREAVRERMSHLNGRARESESRSVCRRIVGLLPDVPSAVCAYSPLPDEVDVTAAMEEILKRGHALYLPRHEKNALVFRRVMSLAEVRKGTFGIGEPPEEGEELQPDAASLVLLPGRAFDREGRRLGRGNGGYDIWLAKIRPRTAARVIGVCYECQIVDGIPEERHDQRMDAVVTARGIITK